MIESLNDNHGSNEPTDEVYEQAENSILKMKILKIKFYGDFQVADLLPIIILKKT
jgi:hypothetical protein